MYTHDYADKVERLRRSCDRFGLAHHLRQVPTVHQSISARGTADPSYTKARFILDVLARQGGPVLYVDADCEFCEAPGLIGELLAAGTEFAIYNWAADRQTEAYVPVQIVMPNGEPSGPKRFFRFASKFDFYDPSQLLCSGAVQLYADTPAARELLEQWQRAILRNPGSADDDCLCYAWNNRAASLTGLRASWLPKEYARYAWWIYVKPVINHPDFAASAVHFASIPESDGKKQFYPERAERLDAPRLFPLDRIIDVERRRLLKIEAKTITLDEPIEREFWT